MSALTERGNNRLENPLLWPRLSLGTYGIQITVITGLSIVHVNDSWMTHEQI
jgi:hypothetical protein